MNAPFVFKCPRIRACNRPRIVDIRPDIEGSFVEEGDFILRVATAKGERNVVSGKSGFVTMFVSPGSPVEAGAMLFKISEEIEKASDAAFRAAPQPQAHENRKDPKGENAPDQSAKKRSKSPNGSSRLFSRTLQIVGLFVLAAALYAAYVTYDERFGMDYATAFDEFWDKAEQRQFRDGFEFDRNALAITTPYWGTDGQSSIAAGKTLEHTHAELWKQVEAGLAAKFIETNVTCIYPVIGDVFEEGGNGRLGRSCCLDLRRRPSVRKASGSIRRRQKVCHTLSRAGDGTRGQNADRRARESQLQNRSFSA